MMKVGFTGTRQGMTDQQKSAVAALLKHVNAIQLNHGDCVGADEDAAGLADALECTIVVHPPVDESLRAFAAGADQTREPKTHFARNRDIVNETDMLVATPWQTTRPPPKSGGGTWYTVEFAEKQGKPVVIVWPDGRVEKRGG